VGVLFYPLFFVLRHSSVLPVTRGESSSHALESNPLTPLLTQERERIIWGAGRRDEEYHKGLEVESEIKQAEDVIVDRGLQRAHIEVSCGGRFFLSWLGPGSYR